MKKSRRKLNALDLYHTLFTQGRKLVWKKQESYNYLLKESQKVEGASTF